MKLLDFSDSKERNFLKSFCKFYAIPLILGMFVESPDRLGEMFWSFQSGYRVEGSTVLELALLEHWGFRVLLLKVVRLHAEEYKVKKKEVTLLYIYNTRHILSITSNWTQLKKAYFVILIDLHKINHLEYVEIQNYFN